MTSTDTRTACTLCDTVKPDNRALRDHVLNVHPDQHCGLYHQQPCQHDRRERYMAALLEADTYAQLERRDDRARLADAVIAVADAEVPTAFRVAADIAESLRQFEPATGARKAAQISENVGILRVAAALRQLADGQPTVELPGGFKRTTAVTVDCAACGYHFGETEFIHAFDSVEEATDTVVGAGWDELRDGRVVCEDQDEKHQALRSEVGVVNDSDEA
jgi:hypothetical protein